MTTARSAAPRRAPWVRAAVLPSLVVGLLATAVSAAADGSAGAWGALLGLVLVTGFFVLGQVVLSVLRSIEPVMLLLVALMTYGLQIVVLLAVYASFQRHPSWGDAVSTQALGITVLACTAVWLVGIVWASRRERILLFEPLPDDGSEARAEPPVEAGEPR